MLNLVNRIFKLLLFKKKWRRRNSFNKTRVANIFPLDIVEVGKYSYGPLEIYSWGAKEEGLEIGNFVSIASGVKFILGGNHNIDSFTTYPFKVMCFGESKEAWTKGKIVVEDDVWIGMNSMILSGVTIGQGAIIAAGSVIVKDIPPYAIVAGNPATIIKYRFSEKLIEKILKFDWGKVDINKIEKIQNKLYKKLDEQLYYEIINGLEGEKNRSEG